MSKSFFVLCFVCGVCSSFVGGAVAPFYDLNDDIYSDIRNLLEDHLTRKVVGQVDHPHEVVGWGPNVTLGQVSGVAIDNRGHPVIFHRANRPWDDRSFNSTNHFQEEKPIKEPVILTLDRDTGKLLDSRGAGIFYLPHGITIDFLGNIWLTDVAMHQILKFAPTSDSPSLILGKKLQPGSDNFHFCKPTAVAVTTKGDFFVADGYCNGRIMHFNSDGTLKGQYGHMGSEREPSSLRVPHGLAINEGLDILCIADREHARIICIKAGLSGMSFGEEVAKLQDPNHIQIYDLSFYGNALMGIAGSKKGIMAVGFTADLQQGGIIDEWQPAQEFHNPHSLIVDAKRSAVFVSEVGPNRIWKFTIDVFPREY